MPCDYKKYHPEWKEIVIAIKKRAQNCCELCGAINGTFIWRYTGHPQSWCLCEKDTKHTFPGKVTKVVLTVAHVDQDITNNNPWNLMALCQRCHLKIDLPWKIKNRAKK